MNAAIQQRVEQFVQEILGLVDQVSSERRAAALSAVATVLANATRPAKAGASSTRRSTAPSTARGSRKGAPPPRRPQGRPRALGAPATPAAVEATAVVSSRQPHTPNGTAEWAGKSSKVAGSVGEASEEASVESAAAPENGAASPRPEREAKVLEALRALGRATASDVAERTGQPNGSVVVALRSLVARGQVARTKTERGVEYGLSVTIAVA